MDNGVRDFISSEAEKTDKRAYGYVFSTLILRKYLVGKSVIQGERPTGVGSDAMVEMVLLFFCRLMFGRLISGERGNEVTDYTYSNIFSSAVWEVIKYLAMLITAVAGIDVGFGPLSSFSMFLISLMQVGHDFGEVFRLVSSTFVLALVLCATSGWSSAT